MVGVGQAHIYIMSKRKRHGGSNAPAQKTAKAFAEAISNYSLGFTLGFTVEVLQDNGIFSGMTEADLLEFFQDFGWALDDGRPSPEALERGLLLEDLSTVVRVHGRRLARYSFRLSGTGFVKIISTFMEAVKEEGQ